MESNNHKILKFKALEWMFQVKHCKYVCNELKIGDYIFDAIGTDGSLIYIIEAKQSIADLLSDCNKKDDIRDNINKYRELLIESGDKNKYLDLIEKEQGKSYKFYDDALKKLSVERYIITPEGMITKNAIPIDWGLLEVLDTGEINKEKECEASREYNPKFKELVIKEIARKNTKAFLESQGVQFEDKIVEFPNFLLEKNEV